MAWKVIDISTFNTVSNYSSAANDIDGVIIRCGYRGYGSSGTLVKDNKLETHYSGFRGKTKIGYYWFTQAISDAEAIAEADYVIDTLLSGKDNDMPIFLDSEIADTTSYNGRADNLSKSARTQYTKTWIQRIQSRGYRAGVYASESWFSSNLDFNTIYNTGAYIWVAKYSSKSPSTSYYDAWQYTSSGSISGISGRCDVSHVYTDIANWGGSQTIPVTGVEISETTASIILGGTKQLAAHVLPEDATNQGIIWASHSPSVASVDENGLVTGNSIGEVDIWAEAAEAPNTYWGTCRVSVTEAPPPDPESINISDLSANINVGDYKIIRASVNPSGADQEINWECTDSNVISLTKYTDTGACGVSGLFAGTSILYAEAASNHNIFTPCTITVTGESRPTGVNVSELSHTLKVGEYFDLLASVNPLEGASQEILWDVPDNNIISVTPNPTTTAICRITGVNEGQITIYARAESLPGVYTAVTITVSGYVTIPVTGVTLNTNSLNLEYEEQYLLIPTVVPTNATNTNISWSSSNPSVVTVDNSGKLTAVGSGSCTITVTTEDGGFTDTCVANVEIPVTGVTLSHESINLNVEDTYTLTATVKPSNASNKNITWKSNDPSIAMVDSNGYIRALSEGYAFITVTTEDGGFTDTCAINVSVPEIPVTGVALNSNSININVGNTEVLVATVEPNNATNKAVTWSSSNTSIATVNNGRINAIGLGSCTITVTTEDGGFTDTCIVNVIEDIINVSGVVLDQETLILYVEDTYTLIPIISPNNATNKAVTWSSNNTSIATVNSNGVVTAVSAGSCVITVRTVDGGFTDDCVVTVSAKITGIHLNKSTADIEKSTTETLIATLEPSGVIPKPITWSSSDSSICFVEDNGTLTAVQPGSCTIVASVDEFSATCQVNIVVYPEEIKLSLEEITHIIGVDGPEQLEVLISPYDTTERDIIWTSSNIDVAEYDTTYNIVKYNGDPGRCIITAKDVKGHTAECQVTAYINQPKPHPPAAEVIMENSITLETLPNGAYSNDNGVTWQTSPTFNGLELNTTYRFIQKYVTHGYYIESEPSDPVNITTKDVVHVESVELNTHELDIEIYDETKSYQFSVTVLPEDAANKSVFYSFDNIAIGNIDNYGKLTVNHFGEGTVTVTALDGGLTDTCTVKIYKQWDRPFPPTVTEIYKDKVVLTTTDSMVFSVDGGNVWQPGPVITGLKPKTAYNISCKLLSDGYMLESEPSVPVLIVTPAEDPADPSGGPVLPTGVYLSAHSLHFDLNKNKYATLNYSVTPINVSNPAVYWYSDDDSIIKVNTNGELLALNVGKATIFIRTIYGGKYDLCDCYVYRTTDRPDTPTLKNVTKHSVEINTIEGNEYTMDKEHWQDSGLFDNLTKNSYYTFYQRVKGIGDYQPPSEISYGLTVKTLNDETPGGHSPSGYTWAQEVEVNNIDVYPTPFAVNPDASLTGRYYIFNLIESKHRIRLVEQQEFAGVYGHSLGWVKITDLKLIEDQIYIGDKVIVTGDINIYADGSGTFIHKENAEMYITDIIDGVEYGYAVTDKPGKNRIGFATRDQITKYRTIIIDE